MQNTDILECLEGTHYVDACQRSLHVQSSDIFECLEGTHYVDACQSSLHVQSSDMPECLEGTHYVDICQRSLHMNRAAAFLTVCKVPFIVDYTLLGRNKFSRQGNLLYRNQLNSHVRETL